MPARPGARGFTLIEVMVAMFVLLVGAAGTLSVFAQGQRIQADALRTTRATAIAQDLLASIEQWPYDNQAAPGGPLYNASAGNDADLGDAGLAFEGSSDPLGAGLADHGEADLPAGFTGLPTAALGADYQRFWSVALPLSASGGHDAMSIAVVVRWRAGQGGSSWHRLVLLGTKPNPATVH